MRLEQNEFQSFIDSQPDGTRPIAAFGDAVTPAQNAYGAWAQLLSGAEVAQTAYEVWVNINTVGVATVARECLVTIGIDLAGGTTYTDFIQHLLASEASTYEAIGGVWYCFPVLVPAGASIAAKASVSTVDVTALNVRVVLSCQPTRPDLIRCGTFVRTFGATPASSNGTAIVAGGASEGAWTQIGAALADELWFWEWGLSFNDTTIGALTQHIDVSVGGVGTERIAVQNGVVVTQVSESLSKPNFQGGSRNAVIGEFVYMRVQDSGNNTGHSVVAYGVGGDAMPEADGPYVSDEVNTWGKIIDSAPDGTQPGNVTLGTSLGAISAANTYTSYVQLLSGAQVTDDAYEVWIHVNRLSVSALARDALCTIGVDPTGGSAYQTLVADLQVSCASAMNAGGGYWYRFPVYVKAGSSIAAKWTCNDTTVNTTAPFARVVLFCQPSRPDLIRCGTFVRTFGATPASSSGTAVTPGEAADGTLVQLGSALAEKLWAWQIGFGINNAAMASRSYFADLYVGDGITNRRAVENALFLAGTTEILDNQLGPVWHREAIVGEKVYGRVQCGSTADTGASMAAYGVGGQAPGTGPRSWDISAPVVTLISPAEGDIGVSEEIVVDVTDNGPFRRVFVYTEQGDDWDVVHDGDSFSPRYIGSSRAPIGGGFRYTIRRNGRWRQGSLAVKAFAIDTGGNEAA